MKFLIKNINTILLIGFLVAFSIGFLVWYLHSYKVGDIFFDAHQDDESFVVCNDDRILQYYTVGTHYTNGRKGIREAIFSYLEKYKVSFNERSGYITFRFVINCEGKTGRFRIKMVDQNLKQSTFNPEVLEKLKKSVISLTAWKPGLLNNREVDSYYIINFKIRNGKLQDIF